MSAVTCEAGVHADVLSLSCSTIWSSGRSGPKKLFSLIEYGLWAGESVKDLVDLAVAMMCDIRRDIDNRSVRRYLHTKSASGRRFHFRPP